MLTVNAAANMNNIFKNTPKITEQTINSNDIYENNNVAVPSNIALATFTGISTTDKQNAKEEIKKLQTILKANMSNPPKSNDLQDWGYYTLYMNKLQDKIANLRKICPLDKTNLDEVMMATPQELFNPQKADNIKGQGITFQQALPDNPEELQKNIYTIVPILTTARTVEDLINIGKRDGIKIEVVPDNNGEYFLGIKNIWEKDGYFKIDRDSAVIKYGKYDANDDYVDKEWAKNNADDEGKINDCAVIANAEGVKILENSYVHDDETSITEDDMYKWAGYKAHKDKNAIINAVAWDSPKEISTLEGKIITDVTMGDVEGYAYNNFKQLKKQILSNKLSANPNDDNSAKFIDLIKSGDDESAKALLIQATKSSQ